MNECLNSIGEYILFPSGMFHCGYYNDKSTRIFIKVQLFCAPTKYTDVLRLTRSIMKGKDFTQGHLEDSTLLELREDLINNWDINYSNANYCGQNEQQEDSKEKNYSTSITQEFGGYLRNYVFLSFL
jgi:hypothetical protein